MKRNRLALVISYYLARFNESALKELGFNSFRELFDHASQRLGVNRNYIKLRRDEFDQIYPWRTGWKAPLSRQVVRTMNAFQDFSEVDLRDIVVRILNEKGYLESDEAVEILHLLEDTGSGGKRKGDVVLRMPTGRQAEEFFIEFHKLNSSPEHGFLKDTRELGCGYDFEIVDQSRSWYVEVKGLSALGGGVLFTDKEWKTAISKGDSYYLALVTGIGGDPRISFLKNPAKVLDAKKGIYTTIQISWQVSEKRLKGVMNEGINSGIPIKKGH